MRRIDLPVALVLTLAFSATAVEAGSHGRFMVVSDMHAFACKDAGPCDAPVATCSDPDSPSQLDCTPSHIDTDGCLFDSFIQDLACTQQDKTDFVLIPGDWIAHEYGSSAGNNELKLGIVETMTRRIAQQLPGALIVPALGNNDAYLGDYNVEPCLKADPADCTGSEGLFLKDTLKLWRPLIEAAEEAGTACVANPAPGKDHLEESFLAGGYYSLANPHLPNNCTVVLNTVLFLQKYIAGESKEGITAHGNQAAEAQLEWLKKRLAFARNPPDGSSPRRVWMIYHVPPGANTYSSANDQSPSMMFSTDPAHDYTSEFAELLREYDDVIEAAFGGHTHLDSFRVAREENPETKALEAVSWVHVAPSLTPNHHKNHGGYQWFTYDGGGSTARIKNFFSRRVKLDKGESWDQEYAWSHTYCQPCDYDDKALGKVFRALRDPSVRHHAHDKHYYTLFYGEGDYSSIGGDADWPWYVCAIGNLETKAYADCAAAVKAGSQDR